MTRTTRTVMVVGASRGIGQALVNALAARGDAVIAVSRKACEAPAGVERIEGVDICDEAQVAALAHKLTGRVIDDLVIAAGVLQPVDLEHLDTARIRDQFEVNALGPLRVAHALLGNLHDGSRLAFLTSRMGSIGDNTSGSHYGYRMSKAALNMAGKSLSVDLRSRGIAVRLLHPGFVQTDMTGGQGQITAERSATMLLARLDEMTRDFSGDFVHANGERLPW